MWETESTEMYSVFVSDHRLWGLSCRNGEHAASWRWSLDVRLASDKSTANWTNYIDAALRCPKLTPEDFFVSRLDAGETIYRSDCIALKAHASGSANGPLILPRVSSDSNPDVGCWLGRVERRAGSSCCCRSSERERGASSATSGLGYQYPCEINCPVPRA